MNIITCTYEETTKGDGTIYNTFSTYGYELGNVKEMKKGEWEMTRDDLDDAMPRISKASYLKTIY